MRNLLPGLLIIIAGAAAGCQSKENPLAATLDAQPALVILEGLPHQHYEPEVLAQELESQEHVTLHEFPFYTEELPVSDADQAAVAAVLADENSTRPLAGKPPEKMCGGFHPDYAIQSAEGSAKSTLLICFGCGDIRFFRDDGTLRYYEIRDQRLKNILGKYRQNRPLPQRGP